MDINVAASAANKPELRGGENMNQKLHISLDVDDLQESVAFYSALFNLPPSKQKPGYAKFDVDSPAVVLTMQQVERACDCICGLSHLGIRLASLDEVLAARARLQAAGLATADEMSTTCCYAVQDKIWLTDPTGYRWEVYWVRGDSAVAMDRPAGAEQMCDCGDAGKIPAVATRAACC
jgi:catechol 2,3-dioxygenase-like lactoylglutathione lyase family enzyme